MKYNLINKNENNLTPTELILTNRGIKKEDINAYLNTTDEVINSFNSFGEELLRQGAGILLQAVANMDNCLVVVDSDCDGFTSSALLINYLNMRFPTWTQNKISWFIHAGKQHGLSDCVELAKQYDLIILPDSSSNDFEYHHELAAAGKKVLVLDHHEADVDPSDYKAAVIINNQLSAYPNKELSGVGVTWQFCRYIDSLHGDNYASEFLDLVALGNMADMMSMTSFETKHLINKGFSQDRLKNPFIYYMASKNSYKLGDHITPMGAAFYIAPFVNAMVRSGTPEEKELLFNSMLTFKAFEKIPSNKRGHKLGEMEMVVEQAIRTVTNVKNRQTRAQDAGLDFLEQQIKDNNLLDHKVLLFTLEPGQVDRNIAGLIANKFMAKYQRPCCILTKVTEVEENIVALSNPPQPIQKISYQGSARGYDKSGITNFKDICESFEDTLYAQGHQGAFGLGLPQQSINQFLDYTDDVLSNLSSETIYSVDYDWKKDTVDPDAILAIAELEDLWGKDMDEPWVAISNLRITKDMVNVYVKKTNTIRINIPGVSIMLFNATDEECELFQTEGYIEINLVAKCQKNEFNGMVTPQLLIEEYEINKKSEYFF